MSKSRDRLRGKIIKITKGLFLYRRYSSPNYYIRVRDPRSIKKRYIVRTSLTSNLDDARTAALQYLDSIAKHVTQVPQGRTFDFFAERLVATQDRLVEEGKRHPVLAKLDKQYLYNEASGLVPFFHNRDVATIRTKDCIAYLESLRSKREDIRASSTINHIVSCLRKVLKLARDQGVISELPYVPRPERDDNPRPFFKFYPLVSKDADEYKKLLRAAKDLAAQRHVVHYSQITDELYDLILFLTHTFMRPTTSEVFAIRFQDVSIANNPKRLIINIADGKTGFRPVISTEAAVSTYQRICRRYPKREPSDYLFMPTYKNRSTASAILGRQFSEVVRHAKIVNDRYANQKHSLYSLRHTAICLRLVLSEGKVNILLLAKNCGTSVETISRFYAKHLPPSASAAKNIQSFG